MFLPVSGNEMRASGWDCADFVFVSGDAYVDHPSFGTAILSRLLESKGYRVGIAAQPKTRADITAFGRPRLAFLVNAGALDSMVAHYTAAKKPRSDDAYSPGGKAGFRPDRAVTVYCKMIREAYGDVPIIIGGLEASLRRFAHYDYWSDSVMPSLLVSSGADLLVYGMGERQTLEIAQRLAAGEAVRDIMDVRGTCYLRENAVGVAGVSLPSLDKVTTDMASHAAAVRTQYDEHDAVRGKTLTQSHGGVYLICNPPMPPLTTDELDRVAALPYERYYHPMYEAAGGIPAIQEVEFSITHVRGCFGACNFCSLAFHQGRAITTRSEQSVIDEARALAASPRFKGYIHDVGGPTANFRAPSCERQRESGMCKSKKCLAPSVCKNLVSDHSAYLHMLRELRAIPGVKKVFVRSGIRFDYLLADKSDEFLRELVAHHVSGQLKVAPEHCSPAVLDRMGKPHIEAYREFSRRFYEATKRAGREQYLVPYLMSSHPGSALKDAVNLAVFLKTEGIRPEQVQDFYPTPGTVSTAMYFTGLDPWTMKPVFVPKGAAEKRQQRILLQWFKPENRAEVADALKAAGREDLIGHGKECLITPPAGKGKPKRRN